MRAPGVVEMCNNEISPRGDWPADLLGGPFRRCKVSGRCALAKHPCAAPRLYVYRLVL